VEVGFAGIAKQLWALLHICQGCIFDICKPRRDPMPTLASQEPYKIIKKLSDVVYGIRKSNKHKCKIILSDRLALFHEPQRLREFFEAHGGVFRSPLFI